MEFSHVPVMPDEVLAGLKIQPGGIYLDATFGRGGHALRILERLGPEGALYALDRDPEAVKAAEKIKDPRFKIAHCAFSAMHTQCLEWGIAGRVDGILLDIGVSSPQLDNPGRGFSFERDGPLDMRMDPGTPLDAATIVNTYSAQALAKIFKDYGEERFARRAAAAIVSRRERRPFQGTAELAACLAAAIPGPPGPRHKATRCFQALRIAVNSELDELKKALEDSVEVLASHGRLCVISFHSLEDRIVKKFIKDNAQGQSVPRGLPLTFEQTERMRLATATMEPVGGPIKASDAELAMNIRSRSATLRVASRLVRV